MWCVCGDVFEVCIMFEIICVFFMNGFGVRMEVYVWE